MKRSRDVIANNEHHILEEATYNARRKYPFCSPVTFRWLLLPSGFVMWRPYFADGFPIWLVRIAVVVHAVSGFVLILSIIVHIYAAIWTKGSIRAMTRGTVSDAWAKHHHPGWYRQVTGK